MSFCLPFVSFDSLFIQFPQVWGLGESKEPNATSSHIHPYIQQLMHGHSCTFAIQKWMMQSQNDHADKVYIFSSLKITVQANLVSRLLSPSRHDKCGLGTRLQSSNHVASCIPTRRLLSFVFSKVIMSHRKFSSYKTRFLVRGWDLGIRPTITDILLNFKPR